MRLDTELNGLDGFNLNKIRKVRLNKHIVHGKPRYQTCPNANNLNGFDINGFLTSLTGKQATPAPIVGINSVLKPTTPQSSMVTTTQTGKTFLQNIGDVFTQAAPVVIATVAAAKNQKRIDKIQEQRLAAGQAPLTTEEIGRYMDATAPVTKFQGGVDSGTSKGLMYGGLAIGAAVLIMAMRKRG